MTQNAKILKFLKTGKKLSTAQAMYKFQVQRLAARVYDLRAEGHNIVTTKNSTGMTAYALGSTAA